MCSSRTRRKDWCVRKISRRLRKSRRNPVVPVRDPAARWPGETAPRKNQMRSNRKSRISHKLKVWSKNDYYFNLFKLLELFIINF